MDKKRVLFVQAAEPGAYPPLIHASGIMADSGWDVLVLSAPHRETTLTLPAHAGIRVTAIRRRPSYIVRKTDYLRYAAKAARLALQFRPDVVYASDVLGAWPGAIAARLADATLVYHEHDSPAPEALRPWLARRRAITARAARLVIFPNEARARIARAELGIAADRVRIAGNMPRRAALPPLTARGDGPMLIHYHGNISPDLVPEAAVEAVRLLEGRARLRLTGYEAPGARGYVAQLFERGRMPNGDGLVDYAGERQHGDLLVEASRAHLGLALMPRHSSDVNLRHMAGASNKAFEYMAAGLPLIVSDLPDWREMYVAPGYGRSCDPADPNSIAAVLRWFLDHPDERQAMAARARAKIETDWNYEASFAPIMAVLSDERQRRDA